MARAGFHVRPVFSHPAFLLTLLVAVAGWFTALIGQIVLESKYHAQPSSKGSAVGVPWFGIFLQMFLNIGVFAALATDSVATSRFQLSIFLAVALVMAVIGVNSGIFTDTSYQLAMGAGWLLLAIVDILWLLYFTSEPGAFFPSLFDAGASIHFSSRSPIVGSGSNPARARTGGSVARAGSSLGMAHPGAAMSYPGAYQGVGVKAPGGPGSVTGGLASVSVADLGMGGQGLEDGPPREVQQQGPDEAARFLRQGEGGGPEYAVLKARALYSYSASPDDPNEISFAKGEIVDILDNSGKWWQARKSDGTKGIVPSNYLVLT
ncbi:hypothetical protein JCM21900_004458 [Sporobolomyces salmonicolor]